jgi:hypothetical protein
VNSLCLPFFWCLFRFVSCIVELFWCAPVSRRRARRWQSCRPPPATPGQPISIQRPHPPRPPSQNSSYRSTRAAVGNSSEEPL